MEMVLIGLLAAVLIGVLVLVVRPGAGQMERRLREELSLVRQEMAGMAKADREESANAMDRLNQSLVTTVGQLTEMNERKLESVRQAVETKLTAMQEDNGKRLEQMRQTVDEKLHATLERRLGESFKLVSERLDLVHKGLGEMQTLANGVGDLKRVLSNVKTRGMVGEIQLENLLEQTLTPEQYVKQFKPVESSKDVVEFAVKMPAKDDKNGFVYLPMDAKFPLETYQRLQDVLEAGDVEAVKVVTKELANVITFEAKKIRDKYINPPVTTDFAILFLPIEGLFAEVLRIPGLWETLQRDYRIVVTGPTTLAALLNSLQMGFRTLAIEQRSSEVWQLLGAVKTEFGKFGDILDKTQKKLQEASNTIESAAVRSRAIERKLRDVQALPAGDSDLGADVLLDEE
jgi:DNA recombination protein RmuC